MTRETNYHCDKIWNQTKLSHCVSKWQITTIRALHSWYFQHLPFTRTNDEGLTPALQSSYSGNLTLIISVWYQIFLITTINNYSSCWQKQKSKWLILTSNWIRFSNTALTVAWKKTVQRFQVSHRQQQRTISESWISFALENLIDGIVLIQMHWPLDFWSISSLRIGLHSKRPQLLLLCPWQEMSDRYLGHHAASPIKGIKSD